ncbi:MAG TPA: hypothetical protein DD417_18230 [Elusimicrobia bacterium]|nr:hypothetical protein [Elusimicrobiota bacterium]
MVRSRRIATRVSAAALVLFLLISPVQAGPLSDFGDKIKKGFEDLVKDVKEGLEDLFGGGSGRRDGDGDRSNPQNQNNNNGQGTGIDHGEDGGDDGDDDGASEPGSPGPSGTSAPVPGGGAPPPPPPDTSSPPPPQDEGNSEPPPPPDDTERTGEKSQDKPNDAAWEKQDLAPKPQLDTLAPAPESSATEQPYSLAQIVRQREGVVRSSRENIMSRLQTDFAGADPSRNGRGGSLSGPAGSTAAAAEAARRRADAGGHTGQGRGIYVDAGALGAGAPGGRLPRQEAFQSRADAAQMKMRFGDYRSAIGEADQAIRLDPGSAAGYLLKARILNRMGRFAEAELQAAKAVELSGDDAARAEALQELAWAQLNQGKTQDALANSVAAVRAGKAAGLKEITAKALVTQAFACERLNNRECTLAALDEAAKLDSRFQRYLDLAKAGKRIFDPNAEDSWKLLEAVAEAGGAESQSGFPWLPLAGGLGLSGAAGAWFLRRRSRRRAGAVVRIPGAPGPAASAPAADLLGGKYQLIRVIGTGAGGQVWEAHDHSLDRSAVFKRLAAGSPPAAAGTGAASGREQDLQVARALATLNHPNVVDIYEVLDLPAGLHLVLERMEGETVRQLLTRSGRLPLAEVKRILKSVCVALEFIHSRGIVHRNLKPSNIMMTAQGFVKVMDIALPGRPLDGTAYQAPEAERGMLGLSVDLYALGACFHEMLTGAPPPRAGSRASAKVPGLDPEMDRFIERALAEDPARRIASVREFAAQLAGLPDSAK